MTTPGIIELPSTEEQPHPTYALDDWAIAQVIGELNTEAKCIALLSVPEKLTQLSDIREDLEILGAYDMEEATRFNVLGILKSMDGRFVSLALDPLANGGRGEYWAQMREGPTGEFSRALGGSLLHFSFTHNVSLRKLIGERRRTTDPEQVDSVETRLALLAVLTAESSGSRSGTFKKAQILDRLEGDFSIRPTTTSTHLKRLVDAKFVVAAEQGRHRLELPTLADGREVNEIFMDFLKIVGGFAVNSPEMREQGLSQADEIMQKRGAIPLLVRRSYHSSAHTNKNTPHST
jgi:DNA-binding transcriptional ArsR family regulator